MHWKSTSLEKYLKMKRKNQLLVRFKKSKKLTIYTSRRILTLSNKESSKKWMILGFADKIYRRKMWFFALALEESHQRKDLSICVKYWKIFKKFGMGPRTKYQYFLTNLKKLRKIGSHPNTILLRRSLRWLLMRQILRRIYKFWESTW